MALVANGLWYLSSVPAWWQFRHACANVAATQTRYLLDVLRRNADTEFGRRYDFARIDSVAAYQARVPCSTYDDYAPYLDRIAHGEPNILTADPVRLLEPTSGSTAATKHIPYTAALKAEFQRGLAPWVVNLFSHDPALFRGQAYWSVSPVTHTETRTAGGLPIGFEDDADYLSGWQGHLLRRVLAVPSIVRHIPGETSMASFRYVTLLFLLKSESLRLISVWNPTFLTLLVEPLSRWWPVLAQDIAQGTLSVRLPPAVRAELQRWHDPQPQRAAHIEATFRNIDSPAARHMQLWPHLRWISCWTEGQAARYVSSLAQLFPQAQIQGKGLLATEGFVSLPWMGQAGAALALRSHFFEFEPEAGGSPVLAQALEQDHRYHVILTTGGGLYRYRLNDTVRVMGHWHECPLLRFEGKAAHICDWFGEKLNERHVHASLEAALTHYRLAPAFVMLACDTHLNPPAYTLYIEATADASTLNDVTQTLEQALQTNYHYHYCRHLGQLGPLQLCHIERDGLQTYLTTCQTLGQRAGDIKPVALHRWDGWSRVFAAR